MLIKDGKSKNQQFALGKSNAEERMKAIESEKEIEDLQNRTGSSR